MRTKRQKFKPIEFVDGIVWLKSVEGGKSGLQFAVEVDEKQMEKLEHGAVAEITVRSLNERNTAWEVYEIHD